MDSAAGCQVSLADLGRSAGCLDYVSAFFSEHTADRIRLCLCLQQMAQLADPDRSSRVSSAVDCGPPLAVAL